MKDKVSYNGKLLTLVNKFREKHQLKPLGRLKFLDELAAGHSQDMAKAAFCRHAGYHFRSDVAEQEKGLSRYAENVAQYPAKTYNTYKARELLKGWLASPGHRENILRKDYKYTGIGIAVKRGYIYATQIFAN